MPNQPPPTTPVTPAGHPVPPRGIDQVPSSSTTAGRFGRMFRQVPLFSPAEEDLSRLAGRIIGEADPEKPDGQDEDENPAIPAGYTYLGQFIDHDITFDPVSSLDRQNDPDALTDFRTPRFDLDSLYGRGPADQPFLYEADGIRLRLGEPVDTDPLTAGPDLPRILPRQVLAANRALIGDPRNDENKIVSQLQSLFLRFHNAVVKRIETTGRTGEDLFKDAQRLVRWHYQWVVVHDFLPRIVGQNVVDDILRPAGYAVGGTTPAQASVLRAELLFYRPRVQPYMPVEFSAAAYRFGHSMIRPSYRISEKVTPRAELARIPIFSASTTPTDNMNGFVPIPDSWGIDWSFFFETDPAHAPQRSYKIDTTLSHPLGDLPSVPAPTSLAQRNLERGLRLGLPSGQAVARAMGIVALSDDDLGLGQDTPTLLGNAPLWYYVLKEAEVLGGAAQLGPVGGRIVAEVLVGLLAGDRLSYLNVEPGWKPELVADGEPFGMAQLVDFTIESSGAA